MGQVSEENIRLQFGARESYHSLRALKEDYRFTEVFFAAQHKALSTWQLRLTVA